MSTLSYASEPQIQYLYQVLEQIGRGELVVPEFQRPDRWSGDQRLSLLDSVSKGYPIGSVMVWRTDIHVNFRKQIGPYEVPRSKSPGRQYLLDGFQRLSTLFAALRSPKEANIRDHRDGGRWALGYDLRRRNWTFLDDVDQGEMKFVLDGRLILDSVALLRFQRSLDGDDADELVEVSDRIARAVREYKIPIVPVVTDAVDEAIRTFGLLNTEGTKMSDLDLVAALTWQEDYSLRERLDTAKERLGRLGWGGIDESYILAGIRAALDMDIYTSSGRELGEALRRDPSVLDDVITGFERTARFMRKQFGIVGLGLLPYSYQAVLLADVLRRHPRQPKKALRSALVRWFWWTTAQASFSGMSGYRLSSMLRYLQALDSRADVAWPWSVSAWEPLELPNTSDPRHARIKALALQLFRYQQEDEDLISRLESQAARALIRGVATSGGDLARDPGNRFLLSLEKEDGFVAALEARRRGVRFEHELFRSESYRASHLINDRAWECLGDGDVDRFILTRRIALETDFSMFLTSLGVPDGAVPED